MNFRIKLLLMILSFNLFAQSRNNVNQKFLPIKIDTLDRIELKSEIIIPILSDNKIYTTEKSGIVSCFDNNGNKLWLHKFSTGISVLPVISDQMITVATNNNDIISLNLNNGVQLQAIGISDSITTGLTAIQYNGESELMIPKSGKSNTAIIFGNAAGQIVCYDLETLQEYWRNSDAKGMIKSKLISINNKILYTSKDGFLYCIDARNGLLIWRWKEKEETDFSRSGILCDGKKIFIVDNESSLFCIDLLIGNLTWKSTTKVLPEVGSSADKKKLFAKGLDKKFYIISSSTGKPIKEVRQPFEFKDNKISPSEIRKNIIYANYNSINMMNSKYKTEELYNSGESQIISFQQIGTDKFLIATGDGTIVIIKTKLN